MKEQNRVMLVGYAIGIVLVAGGQLIGLLFGHPMIGGAIGMLLTVPAGKWYGSWWYHQRCREEGIEA